MKKICWGIALITCGVLIMLKRLELLNFSIFFDGWWTLFIIIPALIGLFTDKKKLGSIFWLLLGVALLLSANGLFSMHMIGKFIVPAILVLIGLKIIFEGNISSKALPEDSEIKEDAEYYAAFGGKKLDFSGKKAENVELNATFGGISLDLRNAKIEKDIVIRVSSVFAGIDIMLPENVKIEDKVGVMFGGVNSKKFKASTDEKAKTVFITGNCLFGGVEVK